LIEQIKNASPHLACTGLSGSENALLVAKVYRQLRKPMVVVAQSTRGAERFMEDLRFFLTPEPPQLLFFPPYETLSAKLLSFNNETAARRIHILYQMTQTVTPPIVVTTPGSLLQKLIPKEEILGFAELVLNGEDLDRDALIAKMISGGYSRTTLVEEPGDFSIRGGILDVFSPMYDEPLRIEFFGDQVDSLRFFSPVSQRQTAHAEEAVILPAREIILKLGKMDEIIARIREQAAELQLPVSETRHLIERIKSEGVFPGIESLIPLVYPKPDTFFTYASKDAYFVLLDPKGLESASDAFLLQTMNNFESARAENQFCVEPYRLHLDWKAAEEIISDRNRLDLAWLKLSASGMTAQPPTPSFDMAIKDNADIQSALRTPLDRERLLLPLADWILKQKAGECMTLLICSTASQADRLKALLEPYGVTPAIIENFPDMERGKGIAYICLGKISKGFVWGRESIAIITEDEIFGKKRRFRKSGRRQIRSDLLAVEDLKKEDLVVHIDHGIGQYKGLTKLQLNGMTNDFLLITYKDDDRLYLPVDRMNMVKKYVGVDGILPILDKMGGKSWHKAKSKAKKDVEKIAGELLALYAARKVKSGYAFGKTDSYFQDFEAAFAYEETTDQLTAIDHVLEDMESAVPMDRLVCGDVGYGKTEVALRASFKAVSDSKQVAVLVPTTVLAEQHFKTFTERFERYPVKIACLNRFRNAGEQQKIIKKMKDGTLDIVIGTHRLLQKDVQFKELGLIVLDEEQRFGVKHKEKLKRLKATVDVLALTATPIPRTLHMSLMGIRDISIISTPPEERHAIITYISEFDKGIVTDAIRKELKRNGQIFFIHNNIHTIWKMANTLQELVPEVRLGVAHGRLSENELEQVMLTFVNREIDMLVCTTIVESGLDIPSANTMLINRADRFGLAQIYQLRGRVGRAREQAYAYLFIPEGSRLGKDAQKRLKVLMEYSDLGSGFQIAMSDLQIRGGGAALGVSQSGHIAAVGYDMFLQLMENAISELKGKPALETLEPEINIPMSAFIPESYIQDIDQRLSTYRRLAKMTDLIEISELKAELIDRYGKLPEEATNLLLKIMLKVTAVKGGVKRLDLVGQKLTLHFSNAYQKHPFRLVALVESNPRFFKFTPDHILKVKLKAAGIHSLLAEIKNILKDIARHVNG